MYNRQPSAWEYCLEGASENAETEVVHGWIFKDGQWVAHAWCEFADRAIDLTLSTHSTDKTAYYEKYQISGDRCIRYSRLEFFELVGNEKHFGPYDTDFFFAETSDQDPLEVIAARKGE